MLDRRASRQRSLHQRAIRLLPRDLSANRGRLQVDAELTRPRRRPAAPGPWPPTRLPDSPDRRLRDRGLRCWHRGENGWDSLLLETHPLTAGYLSRGPSIGWLDPLDNTQPRCGDLATASMSAPAPRSSDADALRDRGRGLAECRRGFDRSEAVMNR